jgi:hypothetical protein
MILAEFREKYKPLKDALIIGTFIFACLLSFGFGYLAGSETHERGSVSMGLFEEGSDDGVFASKTGTLYYRSGCSGADRVKESNKIWFTTASAAVAAGYSAARGCEGE